MMSTNEPSDPGRRIAQRRSLAGTEVDRAQFTAQELAAVVEEAHASGLPVTAHAHALVSIRDAVAAGVDGIEHFTFLTAGGVHMPEEVLVARGARASWSARRSVGCRAPSPRRSCVSACARLAWILTPGPDRWSRAVRV